MDCDTSFARRDAKRTGGTGRFGLGRGALAAAGFLAGLLLGGAPQVRAQAAWQDADIGAVAAAGSSSGAGTNFTVSGSGADVWGAADGFHFRYQTWTGDGDYYVRVNSVTNTDPEAKAGLMLRNDLTAGSPNVFVALTPNWAMQLQHRGAAGADTVLDSNVGWFSAGIWLKLTRRGNTFATAYSQDGLNFVGITSVTVPLASTVYVGLAVTSHHDGTICTANFAPAITPNTPPPSGPAAPTGLTVGWRSPYTHLAWTDNSGDENGFEVDRSAVNDPTHFTVAAFLQPNVTSYDDTHIYNQDGWRPGDVFYYRIRAVYYAVAPYGTVGSAWSNYADIAPPPAAIRSVDIGAVGTAGSTTTTNGIDLFGAGAGWGGTADAGRSAMYFLNGDGEFLAKLPPPTNTTGAKGGIMIRWSDDPGSANVFVYRTPSGAIGFQHRDTNGGNTTAVPTVAIGTGPAWLRIVRAGDVFMAYYSAGDYYSTWTTLGSATVPMQIVVQMGFVVSSGDPSALAELHPGEFSTTGQSNFNTPGYSTPAPPDGLTATATSSSQINLTWNDRTADESDFQLEQSTNNATFVQIASPAANSTSYSVTGLNGGTTYYFRVRDSRNGIASTYSNVAAATTPGSPAPTPPAAPTALTATAISSSQIRLNWTDNATNATDYEIQQSRDGVNFGITYAGGGGSETSMTDGGLTANTTYYYRVRAVNSAGASTYSNIASATTQPPPTTPPASGTWASYDVGPVTLTGSDSGSGSSMSVTASGADIWGNADTFRFVYQALTGDGSITARITSMTNTDGWAKAGLMIRETLDANARNAFIAATPTWHGIVAQTRSNIGDVTGQTAGPAVNAPYWLRLVRSGSTIAAATSADGTTWTPLATLNVSMGNAVYIGLAVTSHNQNQLCTANFDNITLTTAAAQTTSSGSVTITGISPGTAISGGATTTTDRTFTMTGTAPPGSRVTIYLNDTNTAELPGTCGSTTADANGVWSILEEMYSAGWYKLAAGTSSAGSPVLTVTVQGGNAAAPTTSNVTVTGQIGTAITPVTVASSNGPNVYSAAGLQNYGLTIAWDTGVISGTPTATANGASVALTVSNGWGSTTATITLNIAATPPSTSGTWNAQDVGTVAATGHTTSSGGTITVAGSGADIWGTADAFQFYSESVSGDFTFTARVASLTDPNAWAKAGLMVRDSLDANARNVFAALTPEQHGVIAQYRTNAAGTTGQIAGPFTYAPYWLRLTRTGNTFNVLASPDGVSWTSCASITWMSLNPTTYVGLAVTSHADGTLCTATFDNVALVSSGTSSTSTGSTGTTGTSTSGWSAADIGAVGVAGWNNASGNTIMVAGSGADIWGTVDAFRFVSKAWTGDGVVEAKVSSMGNTDGWAKAGVMIREQANDPGSRNVFVALTPTWHGIVAQSRADPRVDTTQVAGPAANAPYWVRIARVGNTFTAATSPDGVTWTAFATFNIVMDATINFGFAVTAHDNTQLNEAVFSDPFVGSP